jgi:hypothetical protein
MATTTNYGWATPDDTALVKDGAAAIRTLGSSVDTTTKNLNPSTTLGDIEYRSSSANTNTRLGIGSTGQVLTVASGVPTWATAASGSALTQIVPSSVAVGSGTATVNAKGTITFTSVNTNLSINDCFNATYTNYKIIVDAVGDSGNLGIHMRMRASGTDNSTATSYKVLQTEIDTGATTTTTFFNGNYFTNICLFGSNGTSAYDMSIYRPFATQMTAITQENNTANFSSGLNRWICNGFHSQTTSYDGFSLLTGGAMTGKIRIYGWSE